MVKHQQYMSTAFRNSVIDRPLGTALTCLLLMYAGVTLFTYQKVSITENFGFKNDKNSIHPSSLVLTTSRIGPTVNVNDTNNNDNIDPAIIQLQHTFPIHVGSDTTVIEHPGLAIVEKQTKLGREIPKDLARNITVPQFFDESHGYIYNQQQRGKQYTIRHYLGDGNTLLTPEIASTIGSWYEYPNTASSKIPPLETIYCSIASYRDPECTGSVIDLFDRADYPDRVRVAIIDQRVPNSDDPICAKPNMGTCQENSTQTLCRYGHLIDYYELDARLAVGPVFARHLAHRHYRGEYFAMQIDSHVRFVAHWDTDIIEQWYQAKNEMGVLTTYLSDIQGSIEEGTYKNIHRGRPIMCASDYEGIGQYKHLRHGQQPEGPPGVIGQPTLHPFWAAGFSFARGHFVIQIPYDQYLPMVFQGEEISIGLRGFTYGYDYYAPERSVCFHMYAIKENEARRKKIPLFWENANLYNGVGMRAMKRLNSIIGMTGKFHYKEDEWDASETIKYGLGHIRLKEKFFQVYGIHTNNETVEHHLCRFVGKPMMKIFLPALRANKMGLDYNKIDYEFVDKWPDEPDNGRVRPR